MERDGRHISNRLRKHRRIVGLTQKELADRLGLKNAKQVSRWERGISEPGFKYILRLGLVFKTLIEELFFEERVKEMENLKHIEKTVDSDGEKAVDT